SPSPPPARRPTAIRSRWRSGEGAARRRRRRAPRATAPSRVLESAPFKAETSLLASHETVTEGPEELVARVLTGDRRAEERIVALYGRGVAIILDRHTNGRPEAEDLFQDTFRLVLEKLRRGELREPAKLPAFLAQIARSLAIEHSRRPTRRKTEADSEAVDLAVAPVAGPLS